MQATLVEGELTIYTAAQEKQRLQSFLYSDDDLELDLSAVTEIDSAGLQILIVLKKEAHKLNKRLRFVMHSKPVLEILEFTNLTAWFGDPVVLVH
ncbi:STAS domain-containing protein [Undibacterium squillarum]|uniref:Anti-sigma factor antagonist n=1 Tax=Undibacterium squillarum TaxID=1131567 RepID=A0ABQ2XZW0_9BURK|nr:STAS domain-containing protein [Undibacterium squillarum]GGX47150.1 anti-sigma factor antagonist [Undibacterium squillarum]